MSRPSVVNANVVRREKISLFCNKKKKTKGRVKKIRFPSCKYFLKVATYSLTSGITELFIFIRSLYVRTSYCLLKS